MEDIVAVAVRLDNGAERYFLTWAASRTGWTRRPWSA